MRPLHRACALLVAFAATVGLAACGDGDDDARPGPPPEAFEIDHAAEVAALGGDPARGQEVFRPCASCHRIDLAANRTGPHLVGLFGRQAGSEADFRYSSANRDSQVVWSVATLTPYLQDPRGFMPGTRMNYPGVKPEDIPDLLAYIYEAGGETPPPAASE